MIWPVLLAAVYPVLFTGKDAAGLTKIPAPGVRYRMNMAMATSAPWVDSNIWKYRRNPKAEYLCDVKGKSVVVAMAEAFSTGVKVSLEVSPEQQSDYQQMIAFLKQIPDGPSKPWVNFTLRDDGSAQSGEVLNLMARRNLLFQVDAKGDIALVKVTNPYEFMQELREKLGDDKRILRLFGSELTIAELARDGKRVRLHLVNYGTRPVDHLRIRIKGKYSEKAVRAFVYQDASPRLKEFAFEDGFTEFTLEKLTVYAVLDLTE